MRRKALLAMATLGVVGTAAAAFTAGSGSRPAHVTLDHHAQPLKTTFNRDVGKVRVLLLVAPT